jgi:uracil-DNA glycosylase
VPSLSSRNFLNHARAGQIRRNHRCDHDTRGTGHVERLRSEMAGPIAGRYPDRARKFGILFSHRHLHHSQHRPELALVDLLNLPTLTIFLWPPERENLTALSSQVSGCTLKVARTRAHSQSFAKCIISLLSFARSAFGVRYVLASLFGLMRLNRQELLNQHVTALLRCRRCPRMKSTPVSGGAVVSDVMIIGQAPGPREPLLRRPFAHTAGQTLFRWLEEFCGMNEADVRSKIYFAAVCRCFPGKNTGGTDRVPSPDEIRNCSSWMDDEIRLLRPRLVIPVGRLAIMQFIDCAKLEQVIGRKFDVARAGHRFDVIPLPHPSGASPWHKIPPGKALTERALKLIVRHRAIKSLARRAQRSRR